MKIFSKKSGFTLLELIIAMGITLILIAVLILITNRLDSDNSTNTLSTSSPKTSKESTQYDFWLPFEVSEKEASDSLMNQTAIQIKTVDSSWPSQIDARAKQNKWQNLDEDNYLDGGSTISKYYLSAHVPAVEIFYKWNMSTGKYDSLSLKFIHPAQLPAWLLKIQQDKLVRNEPFDAAGYADCVGALIQLKNPDRVECLKN